MQSMAEQLAENYHNTWGRKKKLELQAKGRLLTVSHVNGQITQQWNVSLCETLY